jgi:hypothetical protein
MSVAVTHGSPRHRRCQLRRIYNADPARILSERARRFVPASKRRRVLRVSIPGVAEEFLPIPISSGPGNKTTGGRPFKPDKTARRFTTAYFHRPRQCHLLREPAMRSPSAKGG